MNASNRMDSVTRRAALVGKKSRAFNSWNWRLRRRGCVADRSVRITMQKRDDGRIEVPALHWTPCRTNIVDGILITTREVEPRHD